MADVAWWSRLRVEQGRQLPASNCRIRTTGTMETTMLLESGPYGPGENYMHNERRVPSFDIKIAESGRMLLARVSGALDAGTAPLFDRRLQPYCAAGRRIVLDLRLTDYVDST